MWKKQVVDKINNRYSRSRYAVKTKIEEKPYILVVSRRGFAIEVALYSGWDESTLVGRQPVLYHYGKFVQAVPGGFVLLNSRRKPILPPANPPNCERAGCC